MGSVRLPVSGRLLIVTLQGVKICGFFTVCRVGAHAPF